MPALDSSTTPAPPAEAEQTPAQRRFAALGSLDAVRDDLHDLYAGRGRWEDTPEGANARNLNDLRTRLDAAQRQATNPNTRRRDRRTAQRESVALVPALAAAEARWQAVGQPAAGDLERTITSIEADIERDDLAQRRQYLASLLVHRARGVAPVDQNALPLAAPAMDREGLGL